MYVYTTAPPQPRNVLGTNGATQAASPVNWARLALIAACGVGAFALYRKATGQPMVPNLLTPWPGIGPTFAYAAGIGPEFALTPFIV